MVESAVTLTPCLLASTFASLQFIFADNLLSSLGSALQPSFSFPVPLGARKRDGALLPSSVLHSFSHRSPLSFHLDHPPLHSPFAFLRSPNTIKGARRKERDASTPFRPSHGHPPRAFSKRRRGGRACSVRKGPLSLSPRAFA